jgi:hypothetical protein
MTTSFEGETSEIQLVNDENEAHIAQAKIFSSNQYILKKTGGKCFYKCHATTIYSVEQAIAILDYIGIETDSEDCLPFALRIVEGGELIVIAEDNGEFGFGDILTDSLKYMEDYNVLICVSRKISDTCAHEMFQSRKSGIIKQSAKEVMEILKDRITNKNNNLRGGMILDEASALSQISVLNVVVPGSAPPAPQSYDIENDKDFLPNIKPQQRLTLKPKNKVMEIGDVFGNLTREREKDIEERISSASGKSKSNNRRK